MSKNEIPGSFLKASALCFSFTNRRRLSAWWIAGALLAAGSPDGRCQAPGGSTAGMEVEEEPDTAVILKQAADAPERILFEEDFEKPDALNMQMYYGGAVPLKIDFSGTTTEQAFSGTNSYKIQVTFDPPQTGKNRGAYFELPIELPQWSELKLTMYVKTVGLPPRGCLHGFSGCSAQAGIEGNNLNGIKTGEKDGWEIWQTTATKTGHLGDYVKPAIRCLLGDDRKDPVTVTVYVDKITVEGRLPADWQTKWPLVCRSIKARFEKEKRAAAEPRLKAMTEWQAALEKRFGALKELPDLPPLLAEQYRALRDDVKKDLATAAPLLETINKQMADTGVVFNANLVEPEVILTRVRRYLDIAKAYPAYAAGYSETDFITFAIDPTQCFPILPTGPDAHNAEECFYFHDQNISRQFESPQVLPDAKPVPAAPGRILRNFGCPGIYVPFSFAIHAGRSLEELKFTVSDLKCGWWRKIKATQVDLRVVAPWYRPYNHQSRLMNELLLHDPEFVVPEEAEQRNKYKDAKFGDDAGRLLPVTIPAGKTRQFYVLVNIPARAKAGVYRGTLTGTARDNTTVAFDLELEVLPFELEPTPYAFTAYYRSYLKDEEFKQKQGIHSWYKTPAQMQAELINMGQHGFNTLCLYDGAPIKTEAGWDFHEIDLRLNMAGKAGLTRSPFLYLGSGLGWNLKAGKRLNAEETLQQVNDLVPVMNEFCRCHGYPRPAYYGADEASGILLLSQAEFYNAINRAGGLIAQACFPNYYSEIGSALSLPIMARGGGTAEGQRSLRQSHRDGYEVWVYDAAMSNMAGSPAVQRRRKGLALWRNGENGVVEWEYSGVPFVETDQAYGSNYTGSCFAFAYPTWSGKPIDTIQYEAYREGIYDTRYMATLRKWLAKARAVNADPALVAQVDKWLAAFSIHDDLQEVRRQMADFTMQLMTAQKK